MKRETIEYFCDITKRPHNESDIATMYLYIGGSEIEFHFSAPGMQLLMDNVKGGKWTQELFQELIENWVKLK